MVSGSLLGRFLRQSLQILKGRKRQRRVRSARLIVEELERRDAPAAGIFKPTFIVLRPDSGPGPSGEGYTPDQIRTAYGINSISFGGVVATADGSGQTLAIVDAYNDPTIATDLDNFDSQVYLSAADKASGTTLKAKYGAASSFFNVYDENGNVVNPTAPPGTLPNSGTTGWSVEESLDVEWAHSIAPGAKIDLIECNSANGSDLYQGVITAAGLTGVSVVSNSWGGGEYSGETSSDGTFTTPAGHQGVTFIASTGDSGAPGGYPAYSPNVIAAGGTSLYLTASNNWSSELGWSGSGGGISQYESTPSYQVGLVIHNGGAIISAGGMRTIPDVSSDADPNTGVAIDDSYDFGAADPWTEVGGTSVAAPTWAGLIAITNQGRVALGGKTLDSGGPQQTLSYLYQLPAADFHDITGDDNSSGNTPSGGGIGYHSGPRYDLVTGRGSDIANLLVPQLADWDLATINPSTMSVGEAGVAYSMTLTTTGGIGSSNMTAKGLPAGLTATASPSKLLISGTPTVSGTFSVTIKSTDSVGDSVSQVYSLKIYPRISFTPATLPAGYLGAAYNQTVAATGGDGSPTITAFSVSSTVPGINVSLSGGQVVISGTPTSGGTVAFKVTGKDSFNTTGVSGSFSFNVTNPKSLVFTQEPTNTISGNTVNPAVVVGILGNTGQKYDGSVTVTLSIVSGPGGFTGGSTTSVTTATGAATFNNISFITTGTYVLKASLTYTSGSSQVTITADSSSFKVTASELSITTEPISNVASGGAFGLVVMAYDASGALATNFQGPVVISIASDSPTGTGLLGTAKLGGTVSLSNGNGVFAFANLNLNQLGTYTLEASSGALVSSPSAPVLVSAGQLVFTTIPTKVSSGGTFTVVVKAEDELGNVDPNFTSNVTLSQNGPAGSQLTVPSPTIIAGVATFNGVSLDKAGNYTLSATAIPVQGEISGTSAQFVVEPTGITFSSVPSSVTSGHAFSVHVEVMDSTGLATSFTGQVTIAAASGPGALGGTLTVNVANGVGTFSNLILNHFGSYTLNASVVGGPSTGPSSVIMVTADAFESGMSYRLPAGMPVTLTFFAIDDLGNVDTNFNTVPTFAVVGVPFRGKVTGTPVVSVDDGVITVTGLTLSTPGVYSFELSADGISSVITISTEGTLQ